MLRRLTEPHACSANRDGARSTLLRASGPPGGASYGPGPLMDGIQLIGDRQRLLLPFKGT